MYVSRNVGISEDTVTFGNFSKGERRDMVKTDKDQLFSFSCNRSFCPIETSRSFINEIFNLKTNRHIRCNERKKKKSGGSHFL